MLDGRPSGGFPPACSGASYRRHCNHLCAETHGFVVLTVVGARECEPYGLPGG